MVVIIYYENQYFNVSFIVRAVRAEKLVAAACKLNNNNINNTLFYFCAIPVNNPVLRRVLAKVIQDCVETFP